VRTIRLLCLSGSLRKGSYNTTVLQAMSALASDETDVILFEYLGILPLFNPDLDDMHIAEVKLLRDAVQQADGLMIASPEYAHGISGVMKNALDWLVSDEGFPGKPVLLLNTSPRASHAQTALVEVLKTMSADVIDTITVPLLGSGLDVGGVLKNAEISKVLKHGLDVFCETILQPSES